MALFKPKNLSNNNTKSNKIMGICEMGIMGFSDRSAEFDWADVFIEIEVGILDSDYSRNIRIRGSFDRDAKGVIVGGSVLNRMYKFFGDIGCTAGINLKGHWEGEDGKPIKDIAKYLNDNHCSKETIPGTTPSLDYLGYVYKELNKKSGKAYTTVHYRLFPNTSAGNVDLASHVKWLKTNGYLKEAPAIVIPVQETVFPAGTAVEDVL